MLKSGSGSIVNTASVAGVTADPGMTPYVAAKHAVVGLTKGAALDYASQGIRINVLAPGLIRTPMTEKGRFVVLCIAAPAAALGLLLIATADSPRPMSSVTGSVVVLMILWFLIREVKERRRNAEGHPTRQAGGN